MILVTGATGFLGGHVARRLASSGRSVRALVRATSDTSRLVGIETVLGDVGDRASIERAMRNANAVVHCAAHYAFGVSDPERTRRTNVDGTRNVLEVAAEKGAIALHVSSVVALGPTGDAPVGESHWSDAPPRSVYQATKREAHLVARALGARIVLPGTIYGRGDRSPVGLLHALGARGLVPIGFRRRVRMSLVCVDDCADLVVRALDHETSGEWIGVAEVVTFEEWLSAIARAAGKKPPRAWIGDRALAMLARAVPERSFLGETLAMSDEASWAFSGDKAKRELGWKPQSLARGLAFTRKRRTGSWIFDSTR